jgi:plastocyanin
MLKPGTARRAYTAAVVAGALVFAFGTGSALAADQIVATDDAFDAPSYAMNQGERPTLLNNGVHSHNVTARTKGPDGGDLFFSPTITGGTTTVDGTQYLTTGTYSFWCSIHPLSMQATLNVSGAGSPAARPDIDVAGKGGKLKKVAKRGKVTVTVIAATASAGVKLVAKLGKATLGSSAVFDLAAGQSRKVTIKLSKSGKAKLAKKKKASIKVTGSVRFGAPDTVKLSLK